MVCPWQPIREPGWDSYWMWNKKGRDVSYVSQLFHSCPSFILTIVHHSCEWVHDCTNEAWRVNQHHVELLLHHHLQFLIHQVIHIQLMMKDWKGGWEFRSIACANATLPLIGCERKWATYDVESGAHSQAHSHKGNSLLETAGTKFFDKEIPHPCKDDYTGVTTHACIQDYLS